MDVNGTVVEVEEQVALEALPAAVRDGLASSHRPAACASAIYTAVWRGTGVARSCLRQRAPSR